MYSLQRTWPPQDTFRLISRAVTMISWFGISCVPWELLAQRLSFGSVVTGSICRGGRYHGLHCWWDLIRPKKLSSVSVCPAQVFAGFSGHGNSNHNIIHVVKNEKKNVHLKRYFFQTVAVLIQLYRRSTWTLEKRRNKNLYGNYTRMFFAVLNKYWKHHATKQQFYGHLPPISQTTPKDEQDM